MTASPNNSPKAPEVLQGSEWHGNRFNRMEWAGAFGDPGTLIPFVVAYIAVLKTDPFGILFSCGAAMVMCGACYKTAFAVQPMKAIGVVAATQAAQTATITQGSVFGADLATGVIWLILGLTGAAKHISRLMPRPGVVGIVLGFMNLGSALFGGVPMCRGAGGMPGMWHSAHARVPHRSSWA